MSGLANGLTTDPEIKELLATFQPETLKPETIIAYGDLEPIVRASRKTARFRTVVSRWRRLLLREHNIDTQAVASVGIEILEENRRVSLGIIDTRSGFRKVRRAMNRIGRADTARLDDHHIAQQSHALRLLRAISDSARDAERTIASAGQIESLPKRSA